MEPKTPRAHLTHTPIQGRRLALTELQKLYLAARAGGKRRHHSALREIARKTGIDEGTVDRCLKRARRTDQIEARRAAAC